jgi:hypothetical protein
MLILVLFGGLVLTSFLLGALAIAVGVTTRYGDPTSSYKLYSIRDALIDTVVFGGVSRSDPWLEALYENVNSILLHSNLLGGPGGWSLAVAVGRYQAINPNAGRKMVPLPSAVEECPAAIHALCPDLQSALRHLASHHLGLYLQTNAYRRAQKRIQREKARQLLRMMGDRDRFSNGVAW